MRRPSEYLASAVRNLRSRVLPDCALALVHGSRSATVIRVGSSMRGEDDLTGDAPAERLRVLALAADFPEISRGDVATLAGGERLVTSVRTDLAAASLYIGFSEMLSRCSANFHGVRDSRVLRFPVGVLVLDNGLSSDLSDAYSPTTVHAWTLAVAADDWPEQLPPQIGDDFNFEHDGATILVRVTRCDLRNRRFILSARSR